MLFCNQAILLNKFINQVASVYAELIDANGTEKMARIAEYGRMRNKKTK